MSKLHLMIDLETLGAGDRVHVPVLQVGGALFQIEDDQAKIVEQWQVSFGLDLATKDVVSPPIDPATMDWWKKQPEETLQAVFFPPYREEMEFGDSYKPPSSTDRVDDSLDFLIDMIDEWEPETVWANGVADFQWLTGLFNRYNRVPPWGYNAPRDYRTVRELAHAKNGGKLEPHPQVGKSHCAVDDAVWQCHMLAKYLKVLEVKL